MNSAIVSPDIEITKWWLTLNLNEWTTLTIFHYFDFPPPPSPLPLCKSCLSILSRHFYLNLVPFQSFLPSLFPFHVIFSQFQVKKNSILHPFSSSFFSFSFPFEKFFFLILNAHKTLSQTFLKFFLIPFFSCIVKELFVWLWIRIEFSSSSIFSLLSLSCCKSKVLNNVNQTQTQHTKQTTIKK